MVTCMTSPLLNRVYDLWGRRELHDFIRQGILLAQNSLRRHYSTGESLVDIIFHTVTTGQFYRITGVEVDAVKRGFLALVRRLNKEMDMGLRDDAQIFTSTEYAGDKCSLYGAEEPFLRISRRPVSKYRRFCVTKNGFFGLVPRGTNEGDRVTILYGGVVPFIIRPQLRDSKTVYTLVGHGYFHGLMHGEALDLPSFAPGEIVLV